MPRPAQATIDLNALRHNLQQVKLLAPTAKIMAVIKADGYGHGICEVADALDAADGLAVARISEARTLREHGIRSRLLLLSEALTKEVIDYCTQQQIDIVLHDTSAVDLVLQQPLQPPVNIWLKHDSGMHRLGLNRQQFERAALAIHNSEQSGDRVYMTHFSSSEEANHEITTSQLDSFQNAIGTLPAAPISVSNSAAIIKASASQSDWVRPGIMLYGSNPLDPAEQPQYPVTLQPVMTLSAPIIAIRTIAAGESVGYNRRWTASRTSTIATVAIGYGDGYPRHARNGTPVKIGSQMAALVGTVSMDMITIDITDCENIAVGDRAVLWGDGLSAEEIARHADTISYELFTSVSKRVPRFYLG